MPRICLLGRTPQGTHPMILVLGSAVAKEGALAEMLALSLEHVTRSRGEPGCISHAVHIDAENPNKLVFVEQWQHESALQDHFRVPASRAFAKAMSGLASAPPQLAVFQASQVGG